MRDPGIVPCAVVPAIYKLLVRAFFASSKQVWGYKRILPVLTKTQEETFDAEHGKQIAIKASVAS